KKDLRLDRKRAREGDALALAARELVRVTFREVVELHHREQPGDPGPDLGLVGAHRLRPHAQAERDVLEDRHVAEQGVVLEDEADAPLADVGIGGVLAMEEHGARVGHLEAGDHAQQRRLARPRWAEQRDELAGRNVEAEVVADDGLAEALVQVAHLDAHRVAPPACAATRRSTTIFSTSVKSARPASSDATANAAANWYSL